MADSTAINISRIVDILNELYELVSTDAMQPVNQYAEHAVVYWHRILEGKDVLLPRLNEDGYAPDAFHFGLEQEPGNRIDAQTPGREAGASREEFAGRLQALATKLEQYFAQSGYRGSSEHCDQIMLEANHFSRFIAASCAESETVSKTASKAVSDAEFNKEANPGHGNGGGPAPADLRNIEELLNFTRSNLFVWEPVLNNVIVSWEQNALGEFDRALRDLAGLIGMDEPERESHRMLPGFPLRPQGRPRSRVTIINPVLRPLRTKPMFVARFIQMVKRLNEMSEVPDETAEGLLREIRYFITMVRNNHFMLASEPSFWERHRAGMPLIRGRPTSHPFLQDPADFFKKAILFHNRTYTVAGGGVDRIYLQVKQLERLYKFSSAVGPRSIHSQLALCLRGWEENRWETFTEGLLQLAETLRKESQGG